MYEIAGIYAYRTRSRTKSISCAQIASDTTEIAFKFRGLAAGVSIRNAKFLESGDFALDDNPLP